MKKIPTLYMRDAENNMRTLTKELHPDCGWVVAGEGIATRKFDGTCCLLRGGVLFKRREIKPDKSDPPGFELVEVDQETGKRVGWEPVGDGPNDQWHREALGNVLGEDVDDTYELCGPKIQGNPERRGYHLLIRHGCYRLFTVPTGWDELREWLQRTIFEGIVWHHPDGRMAKIKRKDFRY